MRRWRLQRGKPESLLPFIKLKHMLIELRSVADGDGVAVEVTIKLFLSAGWDGNQRAGINTPVACRMPKQSSRVSSLTRPLPVAQFECDSTFSADITNARSA